MHHPTQYQTMARVKMNDAQRQSALWREQQRARRLRRRNHKRTHLSLRPTLVYINRMARRAHRALLGMRRTIRNKPVQEPVAKLFDA